MMMGLHMCINVSLIYTLGVLLGEEFNCAVGSEATTCRGPWQLTRLIDVI